ncbi:hypothetical protein HUJ05_006856 [Dendroctonus ponderosae]|nr:hypothetical protein HUJ05_006856 [Dendroctonus ponderosae]
MNKRERGTEGDKPTSTSSGIFSRSEKVRRSPDRTAPTRTRTAEEETSDGEKTSESLEYATIWETLVLFTKVGTDLEKAIEQNTKREIKEIARKIKRHLEKLERMDVLGWMSKHQFGAEKIHIGTQTSPNDGKELAERQTAQEKTCPTCKRSISMSSEIGTQTKAWRNGPNELVLESLANIDKFEKWVEVSKIKWEEGLFTNTEVIRGNPLQTKPTVVKTVLIEPTDTNMEQGIQLLYKQRYPEISEAEDVFAVLEQHSRWRKDETPATSQKIIKIVQGDKEKDLWDRLELLKAETKDDKSVALHCIKRCTTDRLRKMAEAIFHGETTKVTIYSNGTPAAANITARKTAPALIINTGGRSYGDALKQIKAQLNNNDATKIIKNVRKGKNQQLIITTEHNKEQLEALKRAIKDPELQIRDTTKKTETIHVRGLEETVTRKEVTEELERVLGKLEDSELRMSDLRPNTGNTQAVTISLEKRKAEKLLQNPYLRVGLSRARMERRINVSRCRRCWGYSHSENRCTGPDRRKLCFKCGKGDHIAKECTATTNTCLVCDKEHRLGTAGCDSFRKALSRLRKEALRPPWIGATSSDANEVNLNRCRAAHDLVARTTSEEIIDVVIGQEPNLNQRMDFSDTNGDCFINVDNRHKVIDCGKGAGYVHVELEACVLVSCYFSPNRGIGEFESLLHNLGDFIRQTRQSGKRVVMGGDLNAKTNIIGSKTTNQRGRLFQEWIIANELVILNQGDIPTFSNANGSTVIDFTAATEEICQRVTNWRVEAENENLSDHNNIRFVIESRPRDRIPNLGRAGWIVGEEEMRRILAAWRSRHLDSTLTKVKPEQLIESITELLNRHAKRKSGNARRPPVYWWNSDIAALRSICISSRRQLTRAQKQHGSRSSMQELVETHKGNKHALKKEIRKSKVSKWKQLCTELDSDIWGKAYQIVTKRLNLRNRSYPDEKTTSLQIEKLFPKRLLKPWNSEETAETESTQDIPNFTMEELNTVLREKNLRKAPGPDGITGEVLVACAKETPKVFLEVLNSCLQKGEFPAIWKNAKLILIEKPKKSKEGQTTYRPLCLIDEMGKVFEALIKTRLQEDMKNKGLEHKNQYGFTKGKSTIDAILKVKSIADLVKQKAYQHRDVCLMILLDVQNAFNSAPWEEIINALEEGGIAPYIVRILKSYLWDRSITTPSGVQVPVTCGVPQGSILGPTLWNIFYNRVLNLQLGKGVESIAYADDLGIIIGAKNTEILKRKVGYAVSKVTETLDSMGIKVAVEKTESVLLAAPRKITNIVLEVGGKTVATSNSVRYLGVMIDRNLKMRKHIKHTVEKANRMLTLLYRLMPRVGGPRSNKRRILASAVTSAVLYGAPTWHQTLDFKHYSGLLTGINRRLAIMIASGYRTVPTTAIEAIAGTIPIDLLVWERVQVHAHGRDYKSEARKTALEKWQERWSCYDGWAKIFIKDVREWTKRKFGEVDFLTTQAMTGHGVFGSYLKKIKKQDDDDCWFCGAQDTPEHSIFQCPRFQNIRLQFELGCGIKISKSNIGDIILQGEAGWKGTTDMLREIMRIKTQEERRREQEARSLNG